MLTWDVLDVFPLAAGLWVWSWRYTGPKLAHFWQGDQSEGVRGDRGKGGLLVSWAHINSANCDLRGGAEPRLP
jgi:hypothetical protein